jgi:hypothetical protein
MARLQNASELVRVERTAPRRFDLTVTLVNGEIYSFGTRKGHRPTIETAIFIVRGGLEKHALANAKNQEALDHRENLRATLAILEASMEAL